MASTIGPVGDVTRSFDHGLYVIVGSCCSAKGEFGALPWLFQLERKFAVPLELTQGRLRVDKIKVGFGASARGRYPIIRDC